METRMDEQTSQSDLCVALLEEPVSAALQLPSLPETQPEFETRALTPGKRKLITTMTLTSETCKWPFGDPVSPDFHYCGRPPQSGRPYCSAHEAVSRPSSLRRKSS
jgi:GcrA cell cycle regulator